MLMPTLACCICLSIHSLSYNQFLTWSIFSFTHDITKTRSENTAKQLRSEEVRILSILEGNRYLAQSLKRVKTNHNSKSSKRQFSIMWDFNLEK